jgi:hypothetical protein
MSLRTRSRQCGKRCLQSLRAVDERVRAYRWRRLLRCSSNCGRRDVISEVVIAQRLMSAGEPSESAAVEERVAKTVPGSECVHSHISDTSTSLPADQSRPSARLCRPLQPGLPVQHRSAIDIRQAAVFGSGWPESRNSGFAQNATEVCASGIDG